MKRLRERAIGVVAVLLGLAVALPLLPPGFVLRYDMVFVPHPPFSADMLGLSRQLPRSVPSALLVAVLSRVLTGQILQKVVLLGIFAGGAYSAARLVPSARTSARIAGGVLYVWNPMTYERLLLGQWAFLLGYALLPWVAAAALSFRRGEPRSAWRLVLALAAAVAPSPYTGIFAAVIAAAIIVARPRTSEGAGDPGRHRVRIRDAVLVLGAAVAVNLPWLIPGLLHPRVPDRPALAVALFKARSDSPLGTIGSLLSLGGLWRTDLAPPGRGTVAWIPAFLIIAALAVAGWRILGSRWPAGVRNALLGLAAIGVVLAVAPSFAGLRSAVVWVERAFPGGGFLRDSEKFVVPLALVGSVGFGLGVERALAAIPSRGRSSLVAAIVFAGLPIALAPTLASGAAGRLSTANYPSSWSRVERITTGDPRGGAILVLPWHTYMPFAWNRSQTVRQPASVYLSRDVVTSTALEVGTATLPEEDPWAGLAARPATDAQPLLPRLGSLGIRYVLVFKEVEWRSLQPKLGGLRRVLDAPDLSLYVSPGRATRPALPTVSPAPVLVGDAVSLALVLVALFGVFRPGAAGIRRSRLAMLREDRSES